MYRSFFTVGSDYQPLPSTEVTFSVGGAFGETRTVTVQVIDDDVGEADESFIVSLVPMSSENDQGLSVSITIIDDERELNSVYFIGLTSFYIHNNIHVI